jgi:hypothetical protein
VVTETCHNPCIMKVSVELGQYRIIIAVRSSAEQSVLAEQSQLHAFSTLSHAGYSSRPEASGILAVHTLRCAFFSHRRKRSEYRPVHSDVRSMVGPGKE